MNGRTMLYRNFVESSHKKHSDEIFHVLYIPWKVTWTQNGILRQHLPPSCFSWILTKSSWLCPKLAIWAFGDHKIIWMVSLPHNGVLYKMLRLRWRNCVALLHLPLVLLDCFYLTSSPVLRMGSVYDMSGPSCLSNIFKAKHKSGNLTFQREFVLFFSGCWLLLDETRK